jgi:hypothetical protein
VEGNGGRELHTPVSRLLVLLLGGDRYERRRISNNNCRLSATDGGKQPF